MRSHASERLPGYFPANVAGADNASSGRLLIITLPMLETWDRATEYSDSCLVLGMAEMEAGDTIQGLAGRMQGVATPWHVWSSRGLRQVSFLKERVSS